jgi:hypothetical protein
MDMLAITRPIDLQSAGLKQIIIPLKIGLLQCFVIRDAWSRLGKPSALIDRGQILDNVVVESIEADQQNADSGWETQQALFTESVWLELSIGKSPHTFLFFHVTAIERSQVEV